MLMCTNVVWGQPPAHTGAQATASWRELRSALRCCTETHVTRRHPQTRAAWPFAPDSQGVGYGLISNVVFNGFGPRRRDDRGRRHCARGPCAGAPASPACACGSGARVGRRPGWVGARGRGACGRACCVVHGGGALLPTWWQKTQRAGQRAVTARVTAASCARPRPPGHQSGSAPGFGCYYD